MNDPETLKVSELIKQLLELSRTVSQDLPVVVEGYENGLDGIRELRVTEIVSYDGKEYEGEYLEASDVERDRHNYYKCAGKERKAALFIVGRRGNLR
ncbi:MAG TPA: hypothetical protein VGZ00_07830 [Candidatus Baltobacteraceae bacterium]|jgi:hypothetical protein|nr:hypothetical protein [Candidatus Baltobacteraceae bacterium]